MPVRFARLCLLLLCKSKKTYGTIAVRKTSRVEKQHLFAECDATERCCPSLRPEMFRLRST